MAVRREKVVLELEDAGFTTGMARDAALTALLNKELNSLSRDSVKTQRAFSDIDRASTKFGQGAEKSGAQIDRLSGRLRVLTDVATLLVPAGEAVGAVAVPAFTGLASQLGFAALAGGTAILAFQGIGNTLKLLNKASLDPTRENLDAAKVAMEKLSPAARKFAEEIRSLIPEVTRLRDIAAAGLFPGVVEGLQAMEAALPRVEGVVRAVSSALGDIAADTGKSLASDRWTPFLDFIAKEAPSALHDMAKAAGNTAHAVAELWMATEPLNKDFSQWLVDATADLDRWAAGLAKTQGFNDFVDFIESHGPQVADTFAAIGDAVLKVIEAAAPLSGPVLQGVEALAKALGALADSDIGTPLFTAAAALALFNRTAAIATAGKNGLAGFEARLGSSGTKLRGFGANVQATRADLALLGSTALTAGARTERELLRMNSASARLKANLSPIGKGVGLFAGLAVASTGAADGIGLTNTVSLALAGTMLGPWGAAAGAGVGALIDLKSASDSFSEALKRADRDMNAASPDARKLAADLAVLETQQKKLNDAVVQPRGGTAALRAVDQVDQKIAQTKKALDFQVEADRTKANLDFMALGFDATTTGLDSATQSAQDFKNALDKINQALTGRSTFRDFEKSLDEFADRAAKRAELRAKILDAQANVSSAQADVAAAKTPTEKESALNRLKSAKDAVASLRTELENYKNTLDVTTQAGRDNQAALDGIAASAINYAKTIKDPALRAAFLDNARDQFLKAADAAHMGKDAAKKLATELGLLNGVTGKVRIVVDADGAIHVISEVDRRLKLLQRKLNIQTGINLRNQGGKDGDPSTPFAAGGWTGPGSKYQPAGVVHADEYVFSKEATSGNVAYLDALHRQMRGYADGGLVRRFPSAPSPVSVSVSGGIDHDRLVSDVTQAVLAARPIYGDVTIAPHNYSEFKRQMDQDRRASASDGIRR